MTCPVLGHFPHDPIETYTHWVFLTPDRAYKVKRPVRYPFLDYSTLDARRRLCAEEVRLNRRLAPEVYRRVAVLTSDGRIDGSGAPVEYAVEMERLPEEAMLDRLLTDGDVSSADMERIADVLAAFHGRVPRVDELGAPDRVRKVFADNLADSREAMPERWHRMLEESCGRDHARLRDRLSRRVADGRIRDGHGDLHAQNICLPADGRVVLYDCIEFNPGLRGGDVASEVAFLTMDLRHRGHGDLARSFAARYAARSDDPGLLELLPFYERHRASVRGFVAASRRPGSADARSYFRRALVTGARPSAILLCGLPGTGKSTLARALARMLDAAVLRSDVVRKELFGLSPLERHTGGRDEGIYSAEATARTYAALRDRTENLRRTGRHVIVDAVFSTPEQRGLIGNEPGTAVLHVICAESLVRTRLETRARAGDDASDAGWDYYVAAKKRFRPPESPFLVHNGAGPAESAFDPVAEWLAMSETPGA